jgi:hypothetical protein
MTSLLDNLKPYNGSHVDEVQGDGNWELGIGNWELGIGNWELGRTMNHEP